MKKERKKRIIIHKKEKEEKRHESANVNGNKIQDIIPLCGKNTKKKNSF